MPYSEAARRKPSFKTSEVKLHKNRPLGSGAYGIVCEAKYGTLVCAAKIMHSALHGYRLPAERFEQEIELLKTIRHPNVVLYLGVWHDPESDSPVLLMERLDSNLTTFLKETVSLSSHLQFNICLNVIQALAYLHDNNIIHRDLSGNNILMDGNKAKVSDFGMARLIDPKSSHHSSLSTCPGTRVYMPPEALDDKPSYTEKIDCFSFGVLIIQALTRLYPSPGERRRKIQINHPDIPGGTAEVPVKEVDRRRNHISKIDSKHPLLPIACKCLQDEPDDRPSAHKVCEMIQELKETCKGGEGGKDVEPPTKMSLHSPESSYPPTTSYGDYVVVESSPQSQKQESSNSEQTLTPNSQKSTNSQSEASSCSTPDLRFKWKALGISAPCEMFRYSDAVFYEGIGYVLPAESRRIYAYNTHVARGRWSHYANCPYLGSSLSIVKHHLTSIGGKRADTGYRYDVNATGGYASSYTAKLFSISEKHDGSKVWIEKLPEMPTKRAFTTAVNTGATLVVAGGVGGDILQTVEILNIETLQWLIAQDLPQPMWAASAAICGDNVYILGGQNTDGSGLSTVYTCSLESLCQAENCRSPSLMSRITNWIKPAATVPVSVWSKLPDIPVTQATCVSIRGFVVAVGGKNLNSKPTKTVHMYNEAAGRWIPISHSMPAAQYSCFVFNPTDNTIVAVGGKTEGGRVINRTNIAVVVALQHNVAR